MNPTPSQHSSAAAAQAQISITNETRDAHIAASGEAPVHGYGLPCLKCRTYYDSNLTSCPVCRESRRVAADAVAVRTITPEAKDSVALEEQRKRLAYEINSLTYAPTLQDAAIPGVAINTATEPSMCQIEGHSGASAPAIVCEGCYARAGERADLLEAALHIDLKEAAQVVYEAVWADPSDANKTYQNAARALLAELHKRAGISAVLSTIHPMSH
jgi:hypothetical protein